MGSPMKMNAIPAPSTALLAMIMDINFALCRFRGGLTAYYNRRDSGVKLGVLRGWQTHPNHSSIPANDASC